MESATFLWEYLYMDVSSRASEVPSVFGANMRRFREYRGWSQSEVARLMQEAGWPKYSQVAVSRTEEGTRTVRLDEAIAIASLFDRRVDDLLDPQAVSDAWARLRILMDDHSNNVTDLRKAVTNFEGTLRALQVLEAELTVSIAMAGGKAHVSETMEKTLSNASLIQTVSAHDVVDQVHGELSEESHGEYQEEV
ncbi:helix-turn-helix domain-containing protein [Paenarthrobacter sp. NPDC091669]|uniref:helix-turn-helix domain-containing protein n=1 Tax=Paenarthrobacter sp. NPDC091669 TaxID=3364384 RepID=UPI00381C665D